jgi:hypothetical protein
MLKEALMNDLTIRLLAGMACALLALSKAVAADTSTTTPAKVYAIATVSVDSTQIDQYPKHLRAERAINARHGVELVASYRIQFGEDCDSEINIWSAPDAESLRRGLSANERYAPELRQMIRSEVVEIATLNPLDFVKSRSVGNASAPNQTAFGLVLVTIDSAKHGKFVEAMRAETSLEAKHGVNLVASYHIELGDTAGELDVWSAADSETIRQSFFYGPEAPGFAEVIKKEAVEIAGLNMVDPAVK